MSKSPQPTKCPVCHKATVNKDQRGCDNCGARLFWPGDQPELRLESSHVEQCQQARDAGWFMWLPGGPRGTGWYRRDAIQLFS